MHQLRRRLLLPRLPRVRERGLGDNFGVDWVGFFCYSFSGEFSLDELIDGSVMGRFRHWTGANEN